MAFSCPAQSPDRHERIQHPAGPDQVAGDRNVVPVAFVEELLHEGETLKALPIEKGSV
jgi:hypothetical protein